MYKNGFFSRGKREVSAPSRRQIDKSVLFSSLSLKKYTSFAYQW